MTGVHQLQKQITRLHLRTEFLNQISSKYWNARRIIFIAGGLLALAFCNVSGTKAGWIAGGLIAILFTVVTIFHNKVRDSLTRVNSSHLVISYAVFCLKKKNKIKKKWK